MTTARDAVRATGSVVRDTVKVSLDLFKVMIPIIVAVKILKELGAIEYLAWPLRPVMGLMGLPAETGLAWAAAILNNIYTGIVVYASLADTVHLSAAQVTVLCAVMLVAHNIPVEGQIARKSGARMRAQVVLRMVSAVALGVILNTVYSGLGVLSEPSRIFWTPKATDPSLLGWALGEAKNLGWVFLIILGLMAMMRLLAHFKITDAIARLLTPILGLIGIGPSAATITVIGLTMGIAYGGGLIIHESRSGKLTPRDVVYSLSLMGMSHALIEDTLLMMLIGGHVSGILWGRLLFSLAAVALLVRFVERQSETTFRRYYYGAGGAAETGH